MHGKEGGLDREYRTPYLALERIEWGRTNSARVLGEYHQQGRVECSHAVEAERVIAELRAQSESGRAYEKTNAGVYVNVGEAEGWTHELEANGDEEAADEEGDGDDGDGGGGAAAAVYGEKVVVDGVEVDAVGKWYKARKHRK